MRLLDQVHDLVQLPGRVLPAADPVESGDDLLPPDGGVGLHAGLAQRLLVPGSVLDRNGARVDPAVPERVRPCGQPVDGRLDGVLPDLGDEPADRAGEAQPVGLPLHRLGEGEAADDLRQPIGERVHDRLAGDVGPDVPVAPFELLHRDAGAAREALGRLRRLALLVEGDPLGRPALVLVLPALGQVVDRDHEAPRTDVDVVGLGAEQSPAELGQLRLGLAAGERRQLLAADLEQEPRQPRAPRRPRPRPTGTTVRRGARACGRAGCRPGARSATRRRARRAG